MNDSYLKTLEYLEPWEIDRKVEIAHVLCGWFKRQKNADPNESIISINERILRFCKEMQSNGHITFETQPENYTNQPEIKVQARLTYSGLQYLNEYRLTVSNINLNATIRNNFKYQLGLGIITLFAILTTACYSIATYYKVDSPTLKSISTELQRQSISQEKMLQSQKGIDKSLRTMTKETSPKKTGG